MKKCFKCLCEKPLEAFYPHSKMKDGRLNKCKDCTKRDASENRQKNLERIRSYDRMRAAMPHRVAAQEARQKRWLAEHQDRRKAQIRLGNAVRDKKIVPWPVCEIPECNCKPEAHHSDYSRPLMVTWLCRAHHMQAHALTRKTA